MYRSTKTKIVVFFLAIAIGLFAADRATYITNLVQTHQVMPSTMFISN